MSSTGAEILSRQSSIDSITETTRLAWQRVTKFYTNNPPVVMKEVMNGYQLLDPFSSSTIVFWASLILVLDITILNVFFITHDLSKEFHMAYSALTQSGAIATVFLMSIIVGLQIAYSIRKSRNVYLIDYATFKGPDHLKITHDQFMHYTRACGKFEEDQIQFQDKLLRRNGLGGKSYRYIYIYIYHVRHTYTYYIQVQTYFS